MYTYVYVYIYICMYVYYIYIHVYILKYPKIIILGELCLDILQRKVLQVEGVVEAAIGVQPNYSAASLGCSVGMQCPITPSQRNGSLELGVDKGL